MNGKCSTGYNIKVVVPEGVEASHIIGFYGVPTGGASRVAVLLTASRVCIELPCGGKLEVPSMLQIPLVDVPCTCGDPTHWLVKWKDEEDARD